MCRGGYHPPEGEIREDDVGVGVPDDPLPRDDDVEAAIGRPPDDPLPPEDDVWSLLKTALSETEKNALRLILEGGNIKVFADKNGIMLEVLADSINEKASDFIGDTILETDDSLYIYNEYKTQVGLLVKD